MNKKYTTPLLGVTRLPLNSITTVSVDDGWKDEWDEELGADTQESSDEA